MKTLLLLFVLACSSAASAQLKLNYYNKPDDEPTVTFGIINDWSFKALGASDFRGFNLQVGMWADNLGFFSGLAESKLTDSTPATREWAGTVAFRVRLFNDNLQISPYFSHGTHNYQDYGIRAGIKIQDGTWVGLMAGRTMHYGFTLMVSVFRKQ